MRDPVPVILRRLRYVGYVEGTSFLLLLLVPLWWSWRRRQPTEAIAFSRTGPLARLAGRGSLVRRLLAAMAGERTLPLDRLDGLLHEGDLVKFARRPVTEERARAFGQESRALVRAVRDLSRPQPEPGAASGSRPRRETAEVG